MIVTKRFLASPHVSARRSAPPWRCRCWIPWFRRLRQGQPSRRCGWIHLPSDGRDTGALDAGGGRHGLRVQPHFEGAGAFREHVNVLTGLAQVQARALGDGQRRPRARRCGMADRRPSEEDRRRRHTLRHFGGPDRRQALRAVHATGLARNGHGESPSLAGGCDSGYSCAYTNTVSWRTPTTPLPVEMNPRTSSSGCSATATQRSGRAARR